MSEYDALLRELIKQKQQEAPAWYQLRSVGLALVKVAEIMAGTAARDLGTGCIEVDIPCKKCGEIIHIKRGVTDLGSFTARCKCGYEWTIR